VLTGCIPASCDTMSQKSWRADMEVKAPAHGCQ